MTRPQANFRRSVLQGFFLGSSSKTAQARGTVPTGNALQRRPGVEAFQVNLLPKSGGWPLPRDVQLKMESALGANFSDVRIHVGHEASAIGAIAFTWGSDIHFAPGQYNPHTQQGQILLGHELTHVVQQRAGRVANPFGSGVAVVQDQILEAEADRLGMLAATHRLSKIGHNTPAQSSGADSGIINRKINATAKYSLRAPLRRGSGWQIDLALQDKPQLVGSVQLTPAEQGIYISNLRVVLEHRRQGLASQLIDAALRAARSNGYKIAQLEAHPDSPADVDPGALVSMYRKLGFQTTGISKRGNPLMERRT